MSSFMIGDRMVTYKLYNKDCPDDCEIDKLNQVLGDPPEGLIPLKSFFDGVADELFSKRFAPLCAPDSPLISSNITVKFPHELFFQCLDQRIFEIWNQKGYDPVAFPKMGSHSYPDFYNLQRTAERQVMRMKFNEVTIDCILSYLEQKGPAARREEVNEFVYSVLSILVENPPQGPIDFRALIERRREEGASSSSGPAPALTEANALSFCVSLKEEVRRWWAENGYEMSYLDKTPFYRQDFQRLQTLARCLELQKRASEEFLVDELLERARLVSCPLKEVDPLELFTVVNEFVLRLERGKQLHGELYQFLNFAKYIPEIDSKQSRFIEISQKLYAFVNDVKMPDGTFDLNRCRSLNLQEVKELLPFCGFILGSWHHLIRADLESEKFRDLLRL